jgi:glycosyltransferase involved in cell wall biosynthesis
MGIADGWMTHSDLVAFSTLSGFPLNWLRVYGKILYKKYWTKFADGWVVEAKCARDGLAKFLNHGKNNINIVPNTAHKVYWGSNHDVSFPEKNNEIRILTFAGPYPHKNLDIIPDVARELINTYKINRIKFIVTLPENCSIWLSMQHFAKLKKVSDYIENRGVVPIVKGPELYNESHLQFMPTILETYSAVYPESLLMGIPIITTDMEFARDICGDAALYFKPKNYKDAALKIYQLISSKDTWDKIVSNGMQKKTSLITPDAKTAQYIDIIKKMVKQ